MCPKYCLTIEPWPTDGSGEPWLTDGFREESGKKLICKVYEPKHNTKVEIRCSPHSTCTCKVNSTEQKDNKFKSAMADIYWNCTGDYCCYIKHGHQEEDTITLCETDSPSSCQYGGEYCTHCDCAHKQQGPTCKVGLK